MFFRQPQFIKRKTIDFTPLECRYLTVFFNLRTAAALESCQIGNQMWC